MPDFDLTPEPARFEQIALEQLKVAAQAEFSPSVIESMEVRTSDAYSFIFDRLLVQLRAHVYAHKQGQTTVEVPFEQERSVDVIAPRIVQTAIVPAFAGVIVAGAVGSIVGLAIALAWVVMIVVALKRPSKVTVRAAGVATVDVTKYATFPDSTIVYPPELKNPVIHYQSYGRPFYEGEGA